MPRIRKSMFDASVGTLANDSSTLTRNDQSPDFYPTGKDPEERKGKQEETGEEGEEESSVEEQCVQGYSSRINVLCDLTSFRKAQGSWYSQRIPVQGSDFR